MSSLQRPLIFGLLLVTWAGGTVLTRSQDAAPMPMPTSTKAESSSPTLTTDEARMAQEADRTRRENIMMANEALQGAQVYLQAKNWTKAIERFNYVLRMTNIDNNGRNLHTEAKLGLAKADIGLALDDTQQNNFDDAQSLLKQASDLDPQNKNIPIAQRTLDERKKLVLRERRDPESTENNPTLTTEFEQQIATVQRLLFEGDRFYETGQYDKADGRYRQALVIDPYNKAARLRLEKVEIARDKAAKVARETARAQAMYDVDRRWHEVEKPDDTKVSDSTEKTSQESNVARITNKLNTIIIPEISFNQTTVQDAITQLMNKSRELDPDKEGVNFIVKTNVAAPAPDTTKKSSTGTTPRMIAGAEAGASKAAAPEVTAPTPTITLQSTNLTLADALRLVTSLANLKYKIEEYAVFVLPVTDSTSALITRTFNVPPGFFNGGLAAPSSTGIGDPTIRPNGLGTDAPSVGSVEIDVKQQLVDQGVEFPNGSSAAFLAGSSKLVVKNTPEQMEFIDSLIQAKQIEEPQVEIETKYVEFTDTALKALTFNWAVSALRDLNTLPLLEGSNGILNVPTNSNPANLTLPNTAYEGLNDIYLPSSSAPGLHASATQFGGGTANRTQADIPVDGLTELLGSASADSETTGGNSSNQLFLGAVLGQNAFGLLANMIDQLQGVDLLSAPKITVKNRTAGKVEVAREMRYPTNFTKPQFNGSPIVFDGLPRVLLLPAVPSDFQTQAVGVVLDVTPTAYPDRRIDLELKPQVTDFEGFVNYGSNVLEGRIEGPGPVPIIDLVDGFGVLTGLFAPPPPLVSSLGTYKVQQPVFNNRSITTKIQVVDGQTVVMGGLVREDRSEIDDKVPLLGDIPLAGRLFRSHVTQTIKRNLVIFVTARLIRPTGKPRFMQDTGDAIIPAAASVPTTALTPVQPKT